MEVELPASCSPTTTKTEAVKPMLFRDVQSFFHLKSPAKKEHGLRVGTAPKLDGQKLDKWITLLKGSHET